MNFVLILEKNKNLEWLFYVKVPKLPVDGRRFLRFLADLTYFYFSTFFAHKQNLKPYKY